MPSIKELKEKTMTFEKQASSKNDIFAYYIGRPISYVLTIPFLALGLNANFVSFLSLFPSVIGFFLMSFFDNVFIRVIGVFCFILWNFMDGIDGNIARYTGTASASGALWDAVSGYFAMFLFYFAMGISAFNDLEPALESILNLDPMIYIVLGGLSAGSLLFSRLVMYKKIVLMGHGNESMFSKKENYGLLKKIYLNITSVSGFVTIFLFVAILFHMTQFMTILYFCINISILIASAYSLLKK